MKALRTAIVGLTIATVLIVIAACSSASKDNCEKVNRLCSSSTSSDGGTATVTVTCNADKLDDLSNADEVNDCIEGANDCNAAIACLGKGKQ